MGKWVTALNAAMAAVPEPEKAKDSAADVARIVSSVFNNYSGLTTLNERLKSRYETDDKYHREQFIRDINRAVGVNVESTPLNERGSAAVIKTRLVESMDLIKTLNRDLVKRLTSEVWAGIQRGDDALSIKRFILEEKSGYPRWRADLIAGTRQTSCSHSSPRSVKPTSGSRRISGKSPMTAPFGIPTMSARIKSIDGTRTT